jgi:hypothetical protein
MERYKHLLLDVTLPAAVVLGVGLITYALTGGEEEYGKVLVNEIKVEDDETNGNVKNMADDNGAFNISDNHSDIMMDKLDDVLEEFQKQSALINQEVSKANGKLDLISADDPPPWAKKLFDGVDSITSELKLIKQQGNICSKCQCQESLKENTSGSAPSDSKNGLDTDTHTPTPTKTLSDWLQCMENALKDICNDNMTNYKTTLPASPPQKTKTTNQSLINDNNTLNIPGSDPANPSDWSIVKHGCAALLMYVNNLRTQPNVPRYRRISTTNSSFKGQLGPLVGYDKLLNAVGFQKKGSHYEWSWEFSSAGSSTSGVADSVMAGATKNSNANTNSNSANSPAMPDAASVAIIFSEAVKHLEALKVGEVAFKASLINSRLLYPYSTAGAKKDKEKDKDRDRDKEKDTDKNDNGDKNNDTGKDNNNDNDNDKEEHPKLSTPKSLSKSNSEREILSYDEIYTSKSSSIPLSPTPPSPITTPARDEIRTIDSASTARRTAVTHSQPVSPYSPFNTLSLSSYPSLLNRSGTGIGTKVKGASSVTSSLPLAFDDIFKSVKTSSLAVSPQRPALIPTTPDPSPAVSPKPALAPDASSPPPGPILMSSLGEHEEDSNSTVFDPPNGS